MTSALDTLLDLIREASQGGLMEQRAKLAAFMEHYDRAIGLGWPAEDAVLRAEAETTHYTQ